MSFLRTLLMLVFVFSLVGVSGSYANKIKNCSNCDKTTNHTKDLKKRSKLNNKVTWCSYSPYRKDGYQGLLPYFIFHGSRVRNTICSYTLRELEVVNIINKNEGLKSRICHLFQTKMHDNNEPWFYLKNKYNIKCSLINHKTIIASNQTKDPSKRPLAYILDTNICYYATYELNGKKVWNNKRANFIGEAKYRGLDCGVIEENKSIVSSNSETSKPLMSSAELKKEKQKRVELEKKIALLEKEKQKRIELEKKLAALEAEKKKQKIKQKPSNEIGSGFYVSKFRHIVTNQHVVNKCKKITVGDSMNSQIPADLIASDKRNDLAILQTVSMEMASADTKTFVQRLAVQIVPIISGGLMRSEDVSGGEDILVAGYPLGNMVSDTIKVTKGIVSATKGMDNDVSQFEIDAIIRKGNSGGPIYDKRGNIVGVAVSRLNVNRTDTINFGIKGSTVKQFLSAHDIPTKWSNRNKDLTSKDIYKIASKQTVMIICHR